MQCSCVAGSGSADRVRFFVFPAEAGIQGFDVRRLESLWIPAFAGMTILVGVAPIVRTFLFFSITRTAAGMLYSNARIVLPVEARRRPERRGRRPLRCSRDSPL